MLIYLLNEEFDVLLPTDMTTSVQWNTRYYDAGSFEIHLSVSTVQIEDGTLEKYKIAVYVYLEDNGCTGIIQQHEYKDGEYIIKGRTLEFLLNDRVVDTQFNMNGKAEDVARAIINGFIINPVNQSRKMKYIYLGSYRGLGEVISYSLRGKQVGECTGEILYTQELSYQLLYDFVKKQIYFEVFEGVDRTQSQNKNTWAVFSKDLGNIKDKSEEYTYSNNYKNFAYVAGAGEGSARTIVTVNQVKPGEKLKELWVDARDLQQSDASYTSQLVTRGAQKLSDYQQIESVRFQVQSSADIVFSIGDKCEYVNKDLNIVTVSRITEISEVWESGGYEKNIVLGEDQLTLPQKVKRALS